jgi:predicted flap endonuclease-1-like 5' DNA nuclease
MTDKIEELEGIGEKSGAALRQAGITTVAKLLDACSTKGGRQALAQQTGISETQLLRWTNLADLCRINGVSTQYSELLEAVGVDTVKELAGRNADNLVVKIAEINQEKRLVRQAPAAKTVADWIEQAKTLPAVVSY